jgi:sigma-B regulation protein RsbU (phosphoserine phosphatase)
MQEKLLLAPMDAPRRKFWKSWKWVGLVVYVLALLFHQSLPSVVVAAAYIYGVVVLAGLVFFVLRYLRDRLFWRVRNRLIGSFVFVGVIPLLIILGVVSLAVYLLFGQLAGQYMNSALKENERLISEINMELAGHMSAADTAAEFATNAPSVFSNHSAQFPRLAARLSRRLQNGTLEVVSKYDPQAIVQDLSVYPGDKWRGNAASFEGILQNEDSTLLTSFRPVHGAPGFYVETSAPLDRSLEDRLRREKSLYVTFVTDKDADINVTSDGAKVTIKRSGAEDKAVEERINRDLASQNAYVKNDPRRMISWYFALKGKTYEPGKNDLLAIVLFRVPWSVIFENYMVLDDGLSKALLTAFYVLIMLFVGAELISLVIGGTINRHVTRSVHDLYQGILALQKGDLQHRIPVRRSDQLGLLAHSFNQMSGSIGHLLEEVVEKKRLEKELEIAREVQATLFPKQLPHPPGMSIFGGCKPARIVSGDYYDFIIEDDTHLNIVVGDISGKGISAALLMANLQAAMRNQILSSRHEDPEAIAKSLADIMAQLNRQIYRSSPPEKYASLFLSRYDADLHRLWYCNAGHPPPIVLNAHGTEALEATGTVIGLFPDVPYEAKSIELEPGTLFAIFTDGVTEALNKADQEFGDEQLLTALQQSRMRTPEGIWEYVMSRVGDWQSDLPQYDDITLIVAKTG